MGRPEEERGDQHPDQGAVEPGGKLLLDVAPKEDLLGPGLEQDRHQGERQEGQPKVEFKAGKRLVAIGDEGRDDEDGGANPGGPGEMADHPAAAAKKRVGAAPVQEPRRQHRAETEPEKHRQHQQRRCGRIGASHPRHPFRAAAARHKVDHPHHGEEPGDGRDPDKDQPDDQPPKLRPRPRRGDECVMHFCGHQLECLFFFVSLKHFAFELNRNALPLPMVERALRYVCFQMKRKVL